MLADSEPEAPPGRRLLVFAASFLGLLALAQANFATGTPLIAPPIAVVLVLLIATSGLLVWIRGRWSRGLLAMAAGIATMAAAATAVLFQAVAAISMVLLLLGTAGIAAGAVVGVATMRDWWPVARRRAIWVIIGSSSIIGVIANPVPGTRLGVIVALGALLLSWLLRPESNDEER